MKPKLFLSLLLLATVVPGAFAPSDEAKTKAHSRCWVFNGNDGHRTKERLL
jgi:hypothetical protein